MRDLIHIRVIRLLLLAVSMLFLPTASFAQVGVSVSIAPPELPVYDQPICPGTAISGRPGIGPGMVNITGYQAHGCWLRKPGTCGLRAIGVGAAADSFSTMATGARQ